MEGEPGKTLAGWGNKARKGGLPHKGSFIQPVATAGTWGPLGASVEYLRVIPPEGHGSSRLYATNLGGHCFGTAPGAIDFEHSQTAEYGLWSQRKPLIKRCRFLQWKLGPLTKGQKGIWAWQWEAISICSSQYHKA